ncbi:MAG TPA: hypothetical protein ENK02_11615 [Planctomycetes bacterium]|nr:hypothetical protein [Planctomycetota bacterium]
MISSFHSKQLCYILGLLALTSCRVSRRQPTEIPVVRIQTTKGFEQGVSTEEGIIFLGRTAHKGPVKVSYLLGPSPLVEAGKIREGVGPLHFVDLEVSIPKAPISFRAPKPGESLSLILYDGHSPRVLSTRVARDPRIRGTALELPPGYRPKPSDIGAGVFQPSPEGPALVGLLQGVARLGGKSWLLVAGRETWKTHFLKPTPSERKKEVFYRADGTRTIRTSYR